MPCWSVAIGTAQLSDISRLVLQAAQNEALREIVVNALKQALAALDVSSIAVQGQNIVLRFPWGSAVVSSSGVRVQGLDSQAQADAVAQQIEEAVKAFGIELVGEYARASVEQAGAYVSSDKQTEFGRVIQFSMEA